MNLGILHLTVVFYAGVAVGLLVGGNFWLSGGFLIIAIVGVFWSTTPESWGIAPRKEPEP